MKERSKKKSEITCSESIKIIVVPVLGHGVDTQKPFLSLLIIINTNTIATTSSTHRMPGAGGVGGSVYGGREAVQFVLKVRVRIYLALRGALAAWIGACVIGSAVR